MEELWLVCEGGQGSVDVAVLRLVFTRVLGAGIVVESAGGSSPAAAAGFLQSQRGGRVAYVLDRDYRRLEEAENSFRDGSNRFIWRRHSIENYLLPPAVIIRAFQRLRERFQRQYSGRVPAWIAALPTDLAHVADALRDCSRRRAAEEACRLTIHRLWEDLSETAGRVQKRLLAVLPGYETHDLNGWREPLRQEGQRLRDAGAQTAAAVYLEPEALVRRLERFYDQVTAESYVANLQFLNDFHGRELLRQFRNWLEGLNVRLRYERLVRELTDVVAEVYAADRAVFGSDDFLDLANGVREWAGLPSLS